MKRRTILGAFGLLGSGSALTIGSGAFSYVRTDRELTVETAHDNDAYLGLRQLGSGTRSYEDGTPEKVAFSFPGLLERIDDPDRGLGTNSVYEFVYDANEDDTPGLLRITNQGTNDVVVYTEHDTESELVIETFDVTDPDRTALRDDPAALSPGEEVDVGFRIETFDAQPDTYDETLTIVGEVLDV